MAQASDRWWAGAARAGGLACRFAGLLLGTALSLAVYAQETRVVPQAGTVIKVPTRPEVTVPIYAVWREDARATVVLLSGGGGGYGKIGADGWPESLNFLIRTGKQWASYPFNVVMVGRPSDGLDLTSGRVRLDPPHTRDNQMVLDVVRAHSAVPIWMVGTSMGTISTAGAALNDEAGRLAGIVLTSTVMQRLDGAVTTLPLERIRIPVLMVHHTFDACPVCPPSQTSYVMEHLTQSPRKERIMISNGSGAKGKVCEALHYHGYAGAEPETVDRIAQWILQGTHSSP